MASPELKFIVTATDHASAVLGNVGKNTDALSKKTKALADAGRMLGAGAIIAFGAASLKAYSEAEQSQVKLQEAYRKFPAVANVSIESLRAYNDELERKTSTDADSIAAAQATLAQFSLTGDQIKSLTPLMVDYAQVTGTDVTSAAGVLGKAMMGNARALRAIGINFKSTGDRGKDLELIMAALEDKVGGAGEAFRKTAAGDMKQLELQFGNLQEQVGAQLVPAFSKFVEIAVPVLQAFGKLPEPVKSVGVMLGGVAAAALFLGPKLIATAAHLGLIGPAGAGAAAGLTAEAGAATAAGAASATATPKIAMLGRALGPIAIGITATVAAMEGWQFVLDRIGAGADKVNELSDAMKTNNAQAVESALNAYQGAQATGSWQSALALLVGTGGAGFPLIVQGFKNAGDATANLDQQLSLMVTNGQAESAANIIALLGLNADEAKDKFPEYAKSLSGAGAATGELADSGSDAAEALKELTTGMGKGVDQAKLQADTIKNLKSALDDLGGNAIDVDSALAAMYDSFQKGTDEVTKATEDTDKNTDAVTNNRRSLDLHTAAGRAAQGALAEIASKADSVATSMIAAGASTGQVNDKMGEARRAFIRTAMASGLSRKAARELADQYGLIPRNISTTITNNAASTVRQAVIDYIASLNSIPEERRTQIITEYITEGQKPDHPVMGYGGADGDPNTARARGGYITGPGTGTSDSIPARLSNGEYVIRASSVSRAGVALLDDLNDNGVIDNVAITAGSRSVVTGARDRAQAQSAEFWSHTVLQVDGKQLAESLVKYKRSIGNRPLGVS